MRKLGPSPGLTGNAGHLFGLLLGIEPKIDALFAPPQESTVGEDSPELRLLVELMS
jgi:hypothetical protein